MLWKLCIFQHAEVSQLGSPGLILPKDKEDFWKDVAASLPTGTQVAEKNTARTQLEVLNLRQAVLNYLESLGAEVFFQATDYAPMRIVGAGTPQEFWEAKQR